MRNTGDFQMIGSKDKLLRQVLLDYALQPADRQDELMTQSVTQSAEPAFAGQVAGQVTAQVTASTPHLREMASSEVGNRANNNQLLLPADPLNPTLFATRYSLFAALSSGADGGENE
jgi:hypothetical protein